MKHEWKSQEKHLYLPKEKPELITVPAQKFFMIKGKGNPNSAEFAEKIEVLYSLSYAIRMMPKKGYTPKDYYEYTECLCHFCVWKEDSRNQNIGIH